MIHFRKNTDGEKPRRKNSGCLITILVCIVLYVGFSFWMGKMLGEIMSGNTVALESNSIYRLDLKGTLTEQSAEKNPFASFMGAYGEEEAMGLDDILANIRLAKTDDRLLGIYLRGGSLAMAPASAKAIRDALLDFKSSGKFIVAYADNYNQINYYVASVADRICLSPIGSVGWNGLSANKMYFTRVLENIGVEMQIFKVGQFKSAVEPFFRTSMSPEDSLQTLTFVQGIWDEMCTAVSASRNIPFEDLNTYADSYMGLKDPQTYIDYKLVDTLVYTQGMDSLLRGFISVPDFDGDFSTISTSDLASVKRDTKSSSNKVAVVYAEGEISDEGSQGISGKRFVKLFKKIGEEKDVKAVVFRVNSPGGSADASELIWHAITLLQQKGLPVVVSMGDYAASGGYYISSGADYIYAEPTTLTGSIGIFGLIPNFTKLRDKIGLDIDGVKTNKHSSLETNLVYGHVDVEEAAMMQNMVERGYDLFTRRCAEGRDIPQDSIKAIGGGRVWLGKDALRLGLVDELGNINDAILKAASLAGIQEDYVLENYPEKENFIKDIIKMLDNSTDEEKLIMKMRELIRKPRIEALAPVVEIK